MTLLAPPFARGYMSLGNLGSGLQVVLFEVLRDIAYPCLRGKRGAAVERGRAQFMDPVDTYAVKEGGGATYGHRRRLGPSIFFFFLIVYWVTR